MENIIVRHFFDYTITMFTLDIFLRRRKLIISILQHYKITLYKIGVTVAPFFCFQFFFICKDFHHLQCFCNVCLAPIFVMSVKYMQKILSYFYRYQLLSNNWRQWKLMQTHVSCELFLALYIMKTSWMKIL